jgi:hypothetical protein
VGLSGERAVIRGVPQRGTSTEGRVAILAEGISEPEPTAGVPMLWGVHWTDIGPAGASVKVQADAVSRRPRRVGPLTFESFQEIVVTKARVRIVDQLRVADHDRKPNRLSKVFKRLQERLISLYAMAQGGLHVKPDPADVFTQTFLSGVVFEDLVVEVVGDDGVGRLRMETMSTAQEGSGWNLQGVQVEATDGRRLTIHEATWIEGSRLVAYGPYSLEGNRKRAVEPRGCFQVRLNDAVEIRGPIRGDADAALCAPSLLMIQGPSESPTAAMPFVEGGWVWPNKQMFRFVKKLPFLALPTIPVLDVQHATDRFQEH